MPYLLIGTKVAVSGELSLSEYMSKDGIAKSPLDVRGDSITLLSYKPAANEPSAPNVNPQIQPIDSIQDGYEIDYPFLSYKIYQ